MFLSHFFPQNASTDFTIIQPSLTPGMHCLQKALQVAGRKLGESTSQWWRWSAGRYAGPLGRLIEDQPQTARMSRVIRPNALEIHGLHMINNIYIYDYIISYH